MDETSEKLDMSGVAALRAERTSRRWLLCSVLPLSRSHPNRTYS